MRIAIIGAGFSGLSVAWHLLQRQPCEVVIFDSKGIGGGASGIAAGLLHPYVGEEGRRSLFASEGIEAAEELIAVSERQLGTSIANREGILRYATDPALKQLLDSHCQTFQDIRPHGEDCFLIESGITVDCPNYLEGLWGAIHAKGGKFVLEQVAHLNALEGFDHIIVAAGAGIAQFPELGELRYRLLKGQVLIAKALAPTALPKKSSIRKGYLALSGQPGMCTLGSTYERGVTDATPDLQTAKRLLLPKISLFFPEEDPVEVIDCKAAVRVIRSGHYFPIATKIKSGLWAFTAMGSRGLLYHGLLGKRLAEAIHTGNEGLLHWGV